MGCRYFVFEFHCSFIINYHLLFVRLLIEGYWEPSVTSWQIVYTYIREYSSFDVQSGLNYYTLFIGMGMSPFEVETFVDSLLTFWIPLLLFHFFYVCFCMFYVAGCWQSIILYISCVLDFVHVEIIFNNK